MKYMISEQESHAAKIPHEVFLSNLIGNHVLWFVAALGVVRSYWQPLALVPVVSSALLIFTFWRARRSRSVDPWYVMCHWQIAARRSAMFMAMLGLLAGVAALGWVGYSHFKIMKEAIWAFIGGVGLLPVMVTVLVLIIMESDALHQASQHKLPSGIVKRFPNPGVEEIPESDSDA